MTCLVAKRDLSAALDHAARLSGTTRPGSTHGHVLLTVDADSLTLTIKTDLFVRQRVPASPALGTHDRQVVLPATLAAQLVKQAPDDQLELDINAAGLHIRGRSTDLRVNAAPGHAEPDAFTAPDTSGGHTFALPADDLVVAITGTQYASATDAFQAVFRGLLLHGRPDGLRLVGTDGYRIALADLPHPTPAFKAVVLASHLRELARLVQGRDALSVQVTASHVTLRAHHLTAHAPTLDGDFPDYERVLPTPAHKITVDTKTLRDAVARVSVMADRTANNRIELAFHQDQLALRAEGDYGRGQDTVHADGGPPWTAAFNARMLSDTLATMSGKTTLAYRDSLSPYLVTSEAPGLCAALAVLRV